MNSDQLRYFELAYTEKSFSAAARQIPVSHQGLTKSIRALERELGVPLFEADGDASTPVPTSYAHELYEYVQVLRSNTRLLHEAFDRLRGEERFTVRLGCSLGVLNAFGPELIDDFVAAHPSVEVPYWESNDALCERGLQEGRYDLVLCVSPVALGCEGEALYESPMYFWLRRDDPLAVHLAQEGRTFLRVGDLAGRDIAIPGTGFKCLTHVREAAQARGVELGRVLELSEIFQLYGYAAEGRVLGFANGTLIDLPVFRRDDSLVALPVEGLTWGFSIARLATHALGDAERWLWNWCLAAARDLPHNALSR